MFYVLKITYIICILFNKVELWIIDLCQQSNIANTLNFYTRFALHQHLRGIKHLHIIIHQSTHVNSI